MGHRRRTGIALGFGALVALGYATHARAGDQESPGAGPVSAPAGAVTTPGTVTTPGPVGPTAAAPARPAAGVKSTALDDIAVDYNEPDPNRRWDAYVRAFFGGLFINYVIWQFDWFRGETFHVTRESIGNNLKTGFVFDDNKFKT